MTNPEDNARNAYAYLVRLCDRMKQTGWLNGYKLSGNDAMLDWTTEGEFATIMLRVLVFGTDSTKTLDPAIIRGLTEYVDTIVRHIENPECDISQTDGQNQFYAQMKEAGWLAGYEVKGATARLAFTPSGTTASAMLHSLFYGNSGGSAANKPMDLSIVDGLIIYIDTIARRISEPADYVSGI